MKISVIIPAYNVEKYLTRCVKSVLCQSYQEFEIILVDDGSTDGTGGICDALEKEDERIVVFHKENGGLSSARNAGIQFSKGEYITFIDSDDYVKRTYLEHLLSAQKQYNADIAVGVMERKDVDDIFCIDVESEHELCSFEISKEKAIESILKSEFPGTSACAKLYKRWIFEKFRFSEGKLYEDFDIMYRIYHDVDLIIGVNIKLYVYCFRGGSIMNSSFRKDNWYLIEIADHVKRFIRQNYPSLLVCAEERYVDCNVKLLCQMGKNNIEEMDIVKENMRSERMMSKHFKREMRLNTRMKMDVISVSPKLFLILRWIYFKLRKVLCTNYLY